MTVTVQNLSGLLSKTTGTWTHTAGAAMETIAVSGVVYDARFRDNDSSGSHSVLIPFSISRTGNVSTITIYCNSTVTLGTFIVEHVG